MLNKKEAIEYIETNKWEGISRIDELMACFDNVQDKLKIVHVAGSNGKGSFCAMISSVLKQAGYKVGTFISPHLIEYNERFLINGKCISDDDFIRLTDKVKQACDSFFLLCWFLPHIGQGIKNCIYVLTSFARQVMIKRKLNQSKRQSCKHNFWYLSVCVWPVDNYQT